MFGNSWRVGRVRGIELRIDISWAIIAVLISYSLYWRYVEIYRGIDNAYAILLGVGSAILFFGSVVFHEFAHAFTAQSRGIPVKSITLFLFGGATHAKVEAKGPGAEFLIALVGPLSSLVLAGAFALLGTLGDAFLPREVAGAFGYLAFVNLALAVFNLVPGFPLDGGRVLRAIIWGATGSLSRATRIASIAGQGFGYLLVAAGLFFVFNGALGAGIWFGAIGWFLTQAARMSYEQLQLRRMLEDVDAEDVMASTVSSIPADITLRQAVDDHFMRSDHSAFPVVDGDEAVGLLSLRRVKQVPRQEWGSRTVRETMGKLDEGCTVSPMTSMADVVERLEGENRRVVVVEDGEVVGIISPSDVARWLQRRQLVES
ncbi:MAG TPA: site-2 protease family protein [Actinomycetota bacterium]